MERLTLRRAAIWGTLALMLIASVFYGQLVPSPLPGIGRLGLFILSPILFVAGVAIGLRCRFPALLAWARARRAHVLPQQKRALAVLTGWMIPVLLAQASGIGLGWLSHLLEGANAWGAYLSGYAMFIAATTGGMIGRLCEIDILLTTDPKAPGGLASSGRVRRR